MKQKIRTIISTISLFTTLALLITVVFSWYVVNKQATVTGGTGSTKGFKKVYISDTYDGTTALTLSNYTSNGFKDHVTISMANDYLLPSSSADGATFYAAKTYSNAGAVTEYQSVSSGYYFVEKEYYVLTTEEEDVTIYLDELSIKATSSGGSIYKAVRASMIHTESGNNYSLIVKSSESDTVLPVNGTASTSKASSDPAVSNAALSSSTTLSLAAVSSESLTAYLITFRVWIEGESSYAISANAGSAFTVNFKFKATGD